jgi:aspartyl-tRNA(Asn)/glutamyl-tRNA(Gln) amidotransferase subunit B
MNSFRHVQRAIDYEIARQADLIDAGGAVVQETRLWNPDKNITQSMRSKEEAHDYRYFPEPDLPPLIVEPRWVDELRASLPELPAERRDRYMGSFGLSAYDASVLTAERPVAEFFDALVAGGATAKAAANWTMGEVQRVMNKESLEAPPISAARLGELILAVEKNVVSGTAAKRVFEEMLTREGSALEVIRALGLEQVSDQDALSKAIDDVLAASPDEVERFKAGKKQLMGFFVGKVMKAMGGKANPGVVNELLTKKLGG